MIEGYDIIADTHGYADRLETLLEKLDYKQHDGVYEHPTRKMLYLGDFTDRGPNIPKTIQIARVMAEHGTAIAVMGNHEYNAIAYATPKPGGDFARPHTISNTRAHFSTLEQYYKLYGRQADAKWQEDLAWFQTLPIYFETESLRVAHACWDARAIDLIKKTFPGGVLTQSDILSLEMDRKTPLSKAVNHTIKGKEFDLHTIDPALGFVDPDGTHRHETRLKWWHQNQGHTTVRLDDILFDVADYAKDQEHDLSLFADHLCTGDDERPLIFGHYWLTGRPQILSPKMACIDFSVAKHGVLTAYRFSGEKTLSNDNLVFV